MPPSGASRQSSSKNWLLPLVWFFLALALAILMVVNGETLANSGVVNQIYYLILVALGLAAAGSRELSPNRISRSEQHSLMLRTKRSA
jgi:hypothetical protein